PMAYNPFVNVYRRAAAPSVWRSITDYFTAAMMTILAEPFRQRGMAVRREALYFFAFFASIFNYLFRLPFFYWVAEQLLLLIDRLLFALAPVMKENAWFCLIKISPPRRGKSS
ncbi:MAG TPA: hypothetical protein VEA41_01725, partial [Salinarimonas sp.]|nr:hypothetical protein [Salinarimonas sp.]